MLSSDKKDIIDDFKFTFEEATPDFQAVDSEISELYNKVVVLEDAAEHYRNANREILKKVTTLMNNLKKNPDKPMINWPTRVEEIDKFLKELNEIHISKPQDNNG